MIRKLLFLLMCLCPSSVWALSWDTVAVCDSLYPSYTHTAGNWTTSGCTETWDCIDEWGATPDSDVTYLSIDTITASDIFMCRIYTWAPVGILKIDSVYWHAQAEKTGGTAGKFTFQYLCEDVAYSSSATATLGTGTYAHYEWGQTSNPELGGDFTVAQINSYPWGINRSTKPTAGYRIRVTQNFMEVFWQQLKQIDTVDGQTELFDNAMKSGTYTNNNYGADTVLPIGRSSTVTSIARLLFFLDTATQTTWLNYFIDSAFLDLTTESMFGGTHDIMAHTVSWGAIPGTATGTAQNGSSCWNYARYGAYADQWVNWDKDGADSTWDDGGRDRAADAMDTVTMSADSTVYSINVTEWLSTATSFDWINDYGHVLGYHLGWHHSTLPIQLRLQQASEALPDTQIQFYSMDNAASTLRPRLRIWGTRR